MSATSEPGFSATQVPLDFPVCFGFATFSRNPVTVCAPSSRSRVLLFRNSKKCPGFVNLSSPPLVAVAELRPARFSMRGTLRAKLPAPMFQGIKHRRECRSGWPSRWAESSRARDYCARSHPDFQPRSEIARETLYSFNSRSVRAKRVVAIFSADGVIVAVAI